MAEFKIKKTCYPAVTVVPDSFIENQMLGANGDYVKIYLYLLYCAKNGYNCIVMPIGGEGAVC